MSVAIRHLRNLVRRQRRSIVLLTQMALVVISNQIAFVLRFDGDVPVPVLEMSRTTLPVLMALRLAGFLRFRLLEGFWRYTSIWDVRNIAVSVTCSSAAFYALMISPLRAAAYPRSVVVIDSLLLIVILAGIRVTGRFYRALHRASDAKRVLIYGAGDAGESIVRDMRHGAACSYEPVGFVDDDPAKKGLRVHGVPVLGDRQALREIVRRTTPDEILIAMPTVDGAVVREVLRLLEPFRIHITRLPNLRDIIDGRISLTQVRNLRTEDLLNRSPVGLDDRAIRNFIGGRRVMVTGAGGSIGSELCRQIASFEPARLVLFERYENSLFAIQNDLQDRGLGRGVAAEIGDVTDASRVDQVLTRYRPEILFHAAAHKHVPLMEQSPCEAVKNNVLGTRLLARAAEHCGVDRFIFISTDKAVNPTSIMGATKRVAELVLQAQAQGSGTSFFTVRFGNVIGSNGSVVPRFLDQIKTGGPVTVTHPEMRRFFMLISEAVQLVLHAAAHGKPGATYVLDMGEPIKVVDLARNLIRLSGHVPDDQIPITFVGLRPGEKLFEELVGAGEVVVPANIDKVIQVRARRVPAPESVRTAVERLEALAREGRRTDVLRQLSAVVPEYTASEERSLPAAAFTSLPAPAARKLEPQPAAMTSARACPVCRSTRVHRSRTRSMVGRLRQSMTARRLHRCLECGWRGWLPVLTGMDVLVRPTPAPDLRALDLHLEQDPASGALAFSPRQLGY